MTSRGTDRIALSPDGTTLYAPELGAPKWIIADAADGSAPQRPSTSLAGLTTRSSQTMAPACISRRRETRGRCRSSTRQTRTIVKEIGPFGNMVRPFTFNGKQTLLFANINDFLGFEIADLKTGRDPRITSKCPA